MSSRRSSWFPIALMVVGASLLLLALAWGLLSPLLRSPQTSATPSSTSESVAAGPSVLYRPADSDWWLTLAGDDRHAQTPLAQRVLQQLSQLDPGGPALSPTWPAPVAMAAAGGLRVFQYPAGTALDISAATTTDGRWHLESLPDAAVLFWLPGDQHSTAVDRVTRPPVGTGSVRRQWLQHRLQWPAESCEALPALLHQMPDHASVYVQVEQQTLRWQVRWTALPPQLGPLLQSLGAPRAQAGTQDQWFWREADLSSLPRANGCSSGTSNVGFVARVWLQDNGLHAALAHPGQRELRGFPLPLPPELRMSNVQLQHASALSSSTTATTWLQQQTLIAEPGTLLAVQHHRDGDFAGMALQLRSDGPDSVLLQWQWPIP